MCLRGRTGAHLRAQGIRRQVGAPSVQFSPVILCNFGPVLTRRRIGASLPELLYFWACSAAHKEPRPTQEAFRDSTSLAPVCT